MAEKKTKILVVDDFATMRRIIKNVLRQAGYDDVVEADDGSTALFKLKTNSIDFVIADWNMPNMTGLDLLKAMRSEEAFKDIPFLMLTAEAQKENVMEAIQAGVNNYVVKPFTPEKLKEKIEQTLAKNERQTA